MVSLARYIIVPAKQFVMDQPTSFDRICLLTQMNGIIVSDSPYHVVAKELDNLKAKAGIPHWDIDVRDPDQQYEPMDLFKTYSAMTNEVVKQFRIIMLIALLFLIVSMSITISGVIREKQYEYGVQLLSGASPAYILTTAYTSVGLLVVTGECIAMVSLANAINAEAALIMLLFMVIIWILSSIVPVRMVLRMNITTIIGGRD